MTWYTINFEGENRHANTYGMYGRKDALLGTAKLIAELKRVAYANNGGLTVTGIHNRP